MTSTDTVGEAKPVDDGWFLPKETRDMLKERFKALKERVELVVFTKEGENDPYNELAHVFCRDLARLDDRISVKFYKIGDKESKRYNVTRSPTILFNPDLYRIRYTGAPAGEEGRSFIETIMLVSQRDAGFEKPFRSALAKLKDKRNLQVFVLPSCPYCPGQVVNAFRAAIERPDLISAECVEASEIKDLALKYNISSVPVTVINGKVISMGLEPEPRFIARLISMEPMEIPEPVPVPGKATDVDVIIAGAGPAGLMAGIYAVRSGLTAVVLEKGMSGGQVAWTPVVENYPGFQSIAGKSLMELISAQAKGYVHVHEGEQLKEIKVGKQVEAVTDKGRYVGKALILATGADHRKLSVPGEDRLYGHGVSYCATCDGYFFKGKKAVVVGGGNTALTDALYLKNIGADVQIVHRSAEFRAERPLKDSVDREKIPVLWNSQVEEILGTEAVTGIRIKDTSGKTSELKADAVFVAVGMIPMSQVAEDIGVMLTEEGFIKTDRGGRTNIPRIYAAGDVTGGARQIVTAVGDGSAAAIAVFEDIANPYWKRAPK